jgi:hypothetical protein
MEMATLQFFKNKYRYPKYSSALASYGSPMDCTPVGVNLHGGTLRVKGTMDDFMSCNYLSISRGGNTLYAWIDDVRFRTEESFDVTYTVDAWRTYQSKIVLGTQFIKRSPNPTNLKDTLLGSVQPYPNIVSQNYSIGSLLNRVCVVQVRGSGAQTMSNTPVQPTPYQFFLVEYPINSWQDCQPLATLMGVLPNNGETKNIVTIYSIPWVDLTGLPSGNLIPVDSAGGQLGPDGGIPGFHLIDSSTDITGLLYHEVKINTDNAADLFKVNHSVNVVIPEAGILNIPDELFATNNVYLRQDIDLFSGACNYMLTTGNNTFYSMSVRGSSVSSIPILSNPEDTYISQNQNALTTSLIGDVANIGLGVAIMGMGGPTGMAAAIAGAGMAGAHHSGMDPGMAAWGAQTAVSGGVGIMENMAQRADGGHAYVNPPAFLGTALASNFNGMFWVVTTTQPVANADLVHTQFGYPQNIVDNLAFPSSGYIETQNCNVESTDGSVPRWALDEINTLFDNGILVK